MGLIGVIASMVAGGIWFLKFINRKVFGKEGTTDHGFTGAFLSKFDELNVDLRENTACTKEMQTSLETTNETLAELLECSKGEMARRSAEGH